MKRLSINDIKLLIWVISVTTIINIFTIFKLKNNADETEMNFSRVFGGKHVLSDLNGEHLAENRVQPQDLAIETEHNNNQNVHKPRSREMNDAVIDVMIKKLEAVGSNFFPTNFGTLPLYNLTRQLGSLKRTSAPKLKYYINKTVKEDYPHWQKVHHNYRQFSLYDPDDPAVDGLLRDLATLPIVKADETRGGTQMKLTLTLENGGLALMKPMRLPREIEANPDHFITDDKERHIAEIAAFQLSRILGFFWIPPTIGRRINMTSELKPLVPDSIKKTFYVSRAGNVCFYGNCSYFCDTPHAFCGSPDTIEVSMMSYLPRNVGTWEWYQPYKNSYSMFRKAYWETHDDLCDKLKQQRPFNNGKLLMDLVDLHTFDFLMGNKDRHSLMYFTEFKNYSFPIPIDNGRGFGRMTDDAISILTPLRQCCMIRKSTLLKYIKIYQGPDKLSDLMEKALAPDPVAPVLIKGHLTSLDRRLLIILRTVAQCIDAGSTSRVVVDDGF